MNYNYSRPVRAQDGVFFRMTDFNKRNYLFKVTQQALRQIAGSEVAVNNPLEPVDRGYPSDKPLPEIQDQPSNIDVYNEHASEIHKIAEQLIDRKSQGEPIVIDPETLAGLTEQAATTH